MPAYGREMHANHAYDAYERHTYEMAVYGMHAYERHAYGQMYT